MTRKAIKGILFDFNGTLFFDSDLHIKAFKKYFTEHGKEEPTAEFITKNIFGRPNPRIYSDNFNPNPTPEECQKFAEDKEGLYRDFCLSSPELMKYTDGAAEMLDWLKEAGIPFCLATGCGIDNISFYTEHMNLGRWFTEDNMPTDRCKTHVIFAIDPITGDLYTNGYYPEGSVLISLLNVDRSYLPEDITVSDAPYLIPNDSISDPTVEFSSGVPYEFEKKRKR